MKPYFISNLCMNVQMFHASFSNTFLNNATKPTNHTPPRISGTCGGGGTLRTHHVSRMYLWVNDGKGWKICK